MNKFASEKAKAALIERIVEKVQNDPCERGGLMWARFQQELLAKDLKISIKTLHRWTDHAPFQRTVAIVDGERTTLLRLLQEGEVPVKTAPDLANIMRKIWVQRIGQAPTAQAHGCLIGLAKAWPEGYQIPIFKAVLYNWPDYASAVKHFIDWIELSNASWPTYKGKLLFRRFYRYPSITYMRLFPEVAVAHYAMTLQAKCEKVPLPVWTIFKSLEAF